MASPIGPLSPMTPAADSDELVHVMTVMLEHRRLVFGLPLLLALLTLGIGLVLPRHYTARAAFVPQSSSGSLARLAGLAAQFGIGLPGQDESVSPDFYAELLRSEQLRRALVDSTYQVMEDGKTVRGTLVDFYHIHKRTPALSREAAVRRLKDDMDVSVGLKTGIVDLAATARQPELAQQVVSQALALLNAFDLKTRQSQAGAERAFAAGRVAQAQGDLRRAEDSLQQFLTQNREYANSPRLTFQHDRLERVVNMRQDVYTNLVQVFEQARIEEVRNTPVITVV
ncbi:MAG TPA: hypothetical protein VNH46_09415, partial [Gemmatimonadales bacterium]|nr:hypothetical protein [Gemmatimonadales bacterium]